MKKLLFIITITLFAFSSQAQGRLQFNQVVTFANDTSFSTSAHNVTRTWDIYTVPANSVVKITKSYKNISTSGSLGCSQSLYFTINGINTTLPSLEGSWLKGGDVIGVYVWQNTHSGSSSYTCQQYDDMFFSIIEYNIIPE